MESAIYDKHVSRPPLVVPGGKRQADPLSIARHLAELGDPDAAGRILGSAIRMAEPLARYCRALGSLLPRPGGRRQNSLHRRDRVENGALRDREAFGSSPFRPGAGSRRAINRATSLLELGNTLHEAGSFEAAAVAYRKYTGLCAGDKRGHYNLGVSLMALRQSPAASASFHRALAIDPAHAEALNNLGVLSQSAGELAEARDFFSRALKVAPGYDDAAYNLASVNSDMNNYGQALEGLSDLLQRDPENADAWNNLGKAMLEIGAPADAVDAFAYALKSNPQLRSARWNSGLASLTLGDLRQGWAGFEFRDGRRHSTLPLWDGSAPEGRDILVHAEQGLGDTIQFVRYLPLLAATGGRVIFECQPELADLMGHVEGVTTVVVRGEPVPHIDCQIPLLSLPRVFETTLGSIPSAEGFPAADPVLVRTWAARMATPPGHRKVGLVWAGNPRHRNDRQRSIQPSDFGTLGQPEDVSYFCLQQKPLSLAASEMPSIRFEGMFDELTFADTAAIVSNLDLVISVDTAVAHLAGVLGRPVWTLLPFAADWRWMQDRTDSPWYPGMRLFRQPRAGDWRSVMSNVRLALDFAGAKGGGSE